MMQSEWAAKVFGDREDPRRRLQAIFGGEVPTSAQPPAAALTWARDILARTSQTADRDVALVVGELRQAEPRLTLKAATFLAEHLVARS
jgi:hypothetical protein